MKIKNKVVIFITILLLCIILGTSILTIEFFTALKGNGYFFGTVYRPSSPSCYIEKDLRTDYENCINNIMDKENNSKKYWDRWPSAEFINIHSANIKLDQDQSYKKYEIFVFASKSGYGKYLYKPNMNIENKTYWEMKNYAGTVAMCNLAE